MKSKKEILYDQISAKLDHFIKQHGAIPGISYFQEYTVFARQLVDSIRRVEYVRIISKKNHAPQRADPSSDIFDPLRAAAIHMQAGNIDEAFWLVFLATHFGKNADSGWRLARDIYGGYRDGITWSWALISADPSQFSRWLSRNHRALKDDGVKRKFGNHRKYESLDPSAQRPMDLIFSSYIDWVTEAGSHAALIENAKALVGPKPEDVFNYLYQSLDRVISFGRMAKFDYLTMIGKLGLANIKPGLAYIKGSTGPQLGGQLLLTGSRNNHMPAEDIESFLALLDQHLSIGMQALEDALCNWQKSPDKYIHFEG